MPSHRFERPLFIPNDRPSHAQRVPSRASDVPYASVTGHSSEYYQAVLDEGRPHALTTARLVLGLLAIVGTVCAGAVLIIDAWFSA